MKKRYIVGLVVLVLAIIIIKTIIGFTSQVEQGISMMDQVFENEEIKEQKDDTNENIKGTGVIKSFNVEEFETGYWTKVEEEYVKNEDTVNPDQKILKLSNQDATAIMSSTIGGKIFIEESKPINKYFIYDLNNVGIEFDIEEIESNKVKVGQKAKISFKYASEAVEGNVCYISKVPMEGLVKVKVKIPYSDLIKLGCNANVEILVNEPIDENVKELTINDTVKKIGKFKITLKNQNENYPQANYEEMLQQMFEEMMKDSQNMPEFEFSEGDEFEIPEEMENVLPEAPEYEFDVEGISEYYNEYWSEYWKSYWKSYYEEYPVGSIVEPTEKE